MCDQERIGHLLSCRRRAGRRRRHPVRAHLGVPRRPRPTRRWWSPSERRGGRSSTSSASAWSSVRQGPPAGRVGRRAGRGGGRDPRGPDRAPVGDAPRLSPCPRRRTRRSGWSARCTSRRCPGIATIADRCRRSSIRPRRRRGPGPLGRLHPKPRAERQRRPGADHGRPVDDRHHDPDRDGGRGRHLVATGHQRRPQRRAGRAGHRLRRRGGVHPGQRTAAVGPDGIMHGCGLATAAMCAVDADVAVWAEGDQATSRPLAAGQRRCLGRRWKRSSSVAPKPSS